MNFEYEKSIARIKKLEKKIFDLRKSRRILMDILARLYYSAPNIKYKKDNIIYFDKYKDRIKP